MTARVLAWVTVEIIRPFVLVCGGLRMMTLVVLGLCVYCWMLCVTMLIWELLLVP